MSNMSERIYEPHVLREYALLADGHRGALIGPSGDVCWMCAPGWDDDAVFASLVGGWSVFAITPTDPFVWGGHYEEGSLIWRSRWVTRDSIIECREALAFPGDARRAILLRRLTAVRGEASAEAVFSPAAHFGERPMTHLVRDNEERWHAMVGPLQMRLTGLAHARVSRDRGLALKAELHVAEGAFVDIVVELSGPGPAGPPPEPERLWARTETHWRAEIPALSTSIASRDARHSYAVLRGMTPPGGGTVAAATMSLPERADAGRNYDYRYVWIRDQCYVGQAAAVDAAHPLLDDAVAFVSRRLLVDGPELRPVYTVNGGPVPDERSLRLPGYPGGSDVLGNRAHRQFQLDIFGEALLLFAASARHGHIDAVLLRAVDVAIGAIGSRWQQPDAGIWEIETRRWAHSRLMCVAGLRAIAPFIPTPQATAAEALADTILASAADCRHPSGRWQRAPDDPRVDAALLIAAIRGATPADDPSSLGTLRAITSELTDDGFVYRFRHDDRPLAATEGAFVLCGFWTALAHHQLGNAVLAGRFFERNRAACGPPALLCEEYDVAEHQLRGNIPQAFAHALLLEASLRLADEPAIHRKESPCPPDHLDRLAPS
ncbi:glycoside hydrolase [Mycolicibacterium fortuitum]|nr:glycoside hydrolase [Mycolicibacterium fortuitum]OBB45586.1 glycoside hydrolase [Mycolicibacterium fortuitum]OBB61083.1 glycoside hydrolase [Mycolicibacterium fortuitum]OBF71235.1 glycoside hydrolase [Mycolicibacterium fortuitum]OBG25030.1 glycoside hydrolase [Mycolicibacterium fortuitum]